MFHRDVFLPHVVPDLLISRPLFIQQQQLKLLSVNLSKQHELVHQRVTSAVSEEANSSARAQTKRGARSIMGG